MDENEIINFDVEFKRYLEILQPYLEHLKDSDIFNICNSWVQRLSNCKENEKPLRNKYTFALCYQIAKGFIDVPFIRDPPDDELPLFNDDLISEASSTEIECVVIDSEVPTTKVLFNNNQPIVLETEHLSQNNECENEKEIGNVSFTDNPTSNDEIYKKENVQRKQSVRCYTGPEMLFSHRTYEGQDNLYNIEPENRTMNLIKKLRDIKTQNKALQDELHVLKQTPGMLNYAINEEQRISNLKTTRSISAKIHMTDSNATLKSLNCKLHDIQESRNNLIDTIANLQDKIEHFEEMKRHEIDDIKAKHKLEIIKIKTSVREEVKDAYEKRMEELKQHYEATNKSIESKYTAEIKNLNLMKDDLVAVKNKDIAEKDNQIAHLKSQLEDQKNKFNVVLCRFLENSGDELRNDNFKYKSEQLEKRLVKMENSKAKCVKAYEAKIACLLREKQFTECSLQLQLARQRAQVVQEITDESQTELKATLDKLETKYKDIVANVQATAIHRRMQDQIALESILQAACGIQSEGCHGTSNQFTVKIPQNQNCDTETSSLYAGNKVGSKSIGENSLVTGYCLNGERMGQLFDRVYIPQRDNGEPLK